MCLVEILLPGRCNCGRKSICNNGSKESRKVGLSNDPPYVYVQCIPQNSMAALKIYCYHSFLAQDEGYNQLAPWWRVVAILLVKQKEE